MKIKVPPHKAIPQGQTIIIKEQREGCFLRTLNCGCAAVVLVVVGVVGFFVWAPQSFGFRNGREMAQQCATAFSGKGFQPATASPASAPTAAPKATGRELFRVLTNAMGDAVDDAMDDVAPGAEPTAAPTAAPNATDRYLFQEFKDSMTDAACYIFAWKSEKSRLPFSLINESIILRFTPTQVSRSSHKMKYELECIIHANLSYVGDQETIAAVRFDDKPARSWKCSPSTNGEGLFIKDARGFLSEFAYARRCRVRFKDFGGQQHDLDFDLGLFSLSNFREKIIECVLKSNPPNVKIVD